MFEEPLDTLTLTFNCQPALMAVSIAAFKVMEKLVMSLQTFSYAEPFIGEKAAPCCHGCLNYFPSSIALKRAEKCHAKTCAFKMWRYGRSYRGR